MKTTLFRLLAAGALFVASMASTSAQQITCNGGDDPGPCNPPRGYYSTISNGPQGLGILPPGGPFNLATGSRCVFNILGDPGPCCPSPLSPQSWNGTGFDPVLGAVSWSFIIPSSCPLSTIVPITPGTCFPAQVDFYFEVTGTLAAFPGTTFSSSGCIHLQGIVNSCNPFQCETFTLMNGPIPFNDQSGNYAFDLDNLKVVLNN